MTRTDKTRESTDLNSFGIGETSFERDLIHKQSQVETEETEYTGL